MSPLLDRAPSAPEEEDLGPMQALTLHLDQEAENGSDANKKKMPLKCTGIPAFRVGKPSITAEPT